MIKHHGYCDDCETACSFHLAADAETWTKMHRSLYHNGEGRIEFNDFLTYTLLDSGAAIL